MIEPLISVIIPVYQVERYLCKCVDSVLKQSYHNLEIFLVDDGSLDHCCEICNEYAKKDSRIHTIHKKNGGLSDARNVALDVIGGEYVTFVDSDDFVSITYISYLYELLSQNKADLSICSLQKVTELPEKTKIIGSFTKEKYLSFSAEGAQKQMLYQKKFDTSACGKLYRKELFNGIRYPKGKLYEDLAITYQLFERCKKIVFGSQPQYYYVQRQQSIMTSPFSVKKMDLIDVADDVFEFTVSHYPKLYHAAVHRLFSANFNVLLQTPADSRKFPEEKQRMKCNIKKYRLTVLLDPNARAKNRVAAFLSYFGFGFIRAVWTHIK